MEKRGDFAFSFLVTNEDYIVRDHRVHQVRAVPGVTFVDTVYRYLQMKGFPLEQVELRNFIFLEPVVTTEQFDRKVRVTLTQSGDFWQITARSQKVKDDVLLSTEWSEHLNGELHLNQSPLVGASLDIERLKRQAKQMEDTEYSYATLRHVGIDHYEFMKLLGKLYIGEGYVLAEVHLGELASGYLDYFYLHPAHLDGATSLPGIFARQKMDIDMTNISAVIPIYIGSFRTKGKFGDKLYVYVEENTLAVPGSNDVFYADIEFYHTDGSKLATYSKFGYKRVRTEESITDLQHISTEQKTDAAKAAVAAPVQTVSTEEVGIGLQAAIELDLQTLIAGLLERPAAEVGIEDDFYELGLDSRNLVHLVHELETKLGEKLYPTLMFEHTNIVSLAEYFAEDFATIYPVAYTVSAPQQLELELALDQTAVSAEVVEAVAEEVVEAVAEDDLKQAIASDLQGMIAKILERDAAEVGVEDDFYELGLDSRNLVYLVHDLEAKLGEKLYPTLLFEHTNIMSLTEYFAEDYATTYPVQVKSQPVQSTASVTTATAEVAPSPSEMLYYRPVWEQRDFSAESKTPLTGSVLVFDEHATLRDTLQKQVGDAAKVILIQPASSFSAVQGASDTYTVDPTSVASYNELFEHLQSQGLVIDKLIHAWSKATATVEVDKLDSLLERGVNSLFAISKALVGRKMKHKVQLFYVYPAQATVQPLDSATVGLGRSVGMEHSKLVVKTIAVKHGASGQWPTTLSAMLVQEFATDAEQEHGICYAGKKRYAQRLQRIDVDTATATDGVKLRENGVYLITGGLGGIGLQVAKHVAQQVKAKLVLVGRSELRAEQQQALQELESYGAQVLYLRGDLAKREDVVAILGQAKGAFGAIHGVIHSAGVIHDAVLARKQLNEFRAVLAPKVDATLLLDELLSAEPLDFFVLFSSTSAITGNVGQSDYAFANSFLDHLAQSRSRLGEAGKRHGKTLAINWPLWQEGGMQVDEQTVQLMMEMTGMHPLRTEQGMQALETALRMPYANVMLIAGDAEKIQAGLASSTTDRDDEIEDMTTETASADDIEILGVSGSQPTKSFMTRWTKMMNKEKATIGRTMIEKDNLFTALKAGGHMFHLLVKLDPGRQLEVIVSGRGTPVLFINGFGFTATSLTHQFHEWTAQHQVINIHHPSVGLSNGNQDLSLSGLASTYVEVLKKLQITTPVHIVAASWGGMIAQTIANEYPELVASLTVACSFVNLDFFESGLKLNDKLKEEFFHLGYEAHYELIEQSVYKNFRETAGYFKYFAKSAEKRYSTMEIMADISVPTLVVSGTKDMVVPAEHSRLLHEKIAESQFFELPEAGHVPHVTHHDAFNKRVLQFMAEQEVKRS